MAKPATESRKYLSHTLAEWACALRYEHLSPLAIEKAKLFWYDSLGCGLGGSQQEDAHILLAHYKEKPEEAKKLIAVGESKADPAVDAGTLAAWTMIVNELLNLDEVLNK